MSLKKKKKKSKQTFTLFVCIKDSQPAKNTSCLSFVSLTPGNNNVNTNSHDGTEIVSSYTLGWIIKNN